MIRLLLLLIFLARCCFCQLKQCYYPDGILNSDLPCDPSANVSACCGQNWLCSTNLYCSTSDGVKWVGSCTDRAWRDPACPLPYVGGQRFNYALNTTACDDGTFCPQANNETCCFNHQGITQIVYHYSAPLPTAAASISEFYAANGYQVANVTSSSSDTPSTKNLSISTSVSLTGTTAPPSTSVIASQAKTTNSTALPFTSSDKPPTDQGTATSGLNSRTKAGVGVGVTVGISVAGILLYFLVRRLRKQHKRDIAHAGTSTNAEVTPPGSRRYEKPELTGEDARKELDAAERTRAELSA